MADVQKSAFSLSSATIMLGEAFVDDVFSLTPELHSVGMVSEVSIGIDSQITELLNGVQQVTVDAKRTGVSGSITGNVYEFTAQNFMRAQAMSGNAGAIKRGVLSAPAAAAAVSLSIDSDPIPGEAGTEITAIGDIPSGSTILIQRVDGEQDYVFPTKTSGAATGVGPYTVPIADPFDIPAGMSFEAGARVWVVPTVGVGNMDADALFCVKIAGTLTNFDRPVVYVAPKVRMVRGFQLAFNETAYASMPWEMKPLLLSAGEVASTDRLDEIGRRQTGLLYVGG
jgi:hypothetical protein